jgi:hypothetical protein
LSILAQERLIEFRMYEANNKKRSSTMTNEFHIYGKVMGQEVTFIGCTKGDVPPGAIRLQTVSEHPEAHWVKWCLRFRRTLTDRSGVEHPLAEYFTNQARIKRLLGDEAITRSEAEQCNGFLAFHSDNPHVLTDMITQARAEKAAGRTVYSADAHLSDVRWNLGLDTKHADNTFKINSVWAAWYSRLIQMECPDLIGFFRVKTALADGLVIEGRTWRAFAEEHADELRYDSFESLTDSEWEYNG